MSTRLSGRVAIITGSGQGIGRATAIAFAREGATVVIATRTATHGKETLRLIEAEGGKAILLQVDIADHEATRTMVDEAAAACGRLDIMIHNAAAFGRCSIEEMDHETLDRLFNVNVKACQRQFEPTGLLHADSGVAAAYAKARRRPHHRHLVGDWAKGLDAGFWRLSGVQSCGYRIHPHRGYRTGRRQHHRERHRTRLHRHAGPVRAEGAIRR